MTNFSLLALPLLIDFGGVVLVLVVVVVVTGGKQSQRLVPTDLDRTVRLDWSLTKVSNSNNLLSPASTCTLFLNT